MPEAVRSLLRLVVPCRTAALEPARQDVLAALHREQVGLSERARYRLELVLEEVLMNITRHAFDDGREHSARVELALADDGSLLLSFEDEGRAFDPSRELPEPAARLADASDGGRGLRLVRRSSSAMEYVRIGGRNRLTVAISR